MTINADAITAVILGLDRWFESVRVDWPTPGYGGPVVHWWNHSLAYRGTGLDWRYEGIIDGYLILWRLSGDQAWLDCARRAGDDLVNGQRPDGYFTSSQFEMNPGEGGTPHEVAADVGLLLLSRELRTLKESASERYLAAARRNLDSYWFGRLWHEPSQTLWDGIGSPSFVPNKAATFVEAVLLLAELTGDDDLVTRFAVPTGARILEMQVHQLGDTLDGAIAQNRFGDDVVESYFPLYIARCVAGLLGLSAKTGDTSFRDAAIAAATFVQRVRLPDGSFPQVLYPRGRVNRNPRWIAGVGDIVRAFDLVATHDVPIDAHPTINWILRGARPDGRIATAQGFHRIIPGISLRERFADDVGVVGWADKSFRALAPYVNATTASRMSPVEGDLTAAIRDYPVLR